MERGCHRRPRPFFQTLQCPSPPGRETGNKNQPICWIPAYAGMTVRGCGVVVKAGSRSLRGYHNPEPPVATAITASEPPPPPAALHFFRFRGHHFLSIAFTSPGRPWRLPVGLWRSECTAPLRRYFELSRESPRAFERPDCWGGLVNGEPVGRLNGTVEDAHAFSARRSWVQALLAPESRGAALAPLAPREADQLR